jgi:hypothetical protein
MRAEIAEQPAALRATIGALLPQVGDAAALAGDAVVDAQTPAILLAADSGPTLDVTVDLARRVTGAGARAYGIRGGDRLAAACTLALPGPRLPEWLVSGLLWSGH